MSDVIGLADVSSKDTGRGSHLKTGGMRRKHNKGKKKMKRAKCKVGQVYDQKLKKCKAAPNRQQSARKRAEGTQKARKFFGGASKTKEIAKMVRNANQIKGEY